MIKGFFKKAACVMLVSLMLLALISVGVSAAVSGSSKISEYICDFENNYSASVSGTIEDSDGSKALKCQVPSNKENGYLIDIQNTNLGQLKLNHGSVYAVTINYKVEFVSAATQSDAATTINLVKHNGNGSFVKLKNFSGASYKPGDTTDWMTTCIVFKASVADSPEFNKVAINVISPTCSSSEEIGVDKNTTTIWFDNIEVVECNGNTSSIAFDSTGGSYCDVLLAQSGEAITLPTPERDLYDFVGWYTDADCTKAFKSKKMPSSLVNKLYAKWKVSDTSIKVEFQTVGGISVDTLVGRTGDALTLPTLERKNYHFAGWYTDKDKKTLCTLTSFPEASITLYPKWEVVPFFCGFENPDDYGEPNGVTFTKRCILSTDDCLNGSSSLYYNFEPSKNDDKPTLYKSLAPVVLINEHGEKFQCTPGVEYVISFEYKVVEVNEPGAFGVITSSAKSAYQNTIVQLNAKKGLQYDKSDVGKGWQKGTVKFVCNPKDNNEEYAYISIAICGDSKIYFDNLVVYEAQAGGYKVNMITFDSQGGSYCETIYGDFNDMITFPSEPTKEGYRFTGWYLNADCDVAFDETVFNYGYLNLYAGWSLIPTEEPQEPEGESAVDSITQESEIENDQIWLFIIIGAGVVVIVAAVVVLVVVKKKKSKNTMSE